MVRKLSEAMTPVPAVVPAQTSLTQALEFMAKHRIGAVLLVDGGGPLGLVTVHDIAAAQAAGRDLAGTTVAEVCSHDLATDLPT